MKRISRAQTGCSAAFDSNIVRTSGPRAARAKPLTHASFSHGAAVRKLRADYGITAASPGGLLHRIRCGGITFTIRFFRARLAAEAGTEDERLCKVTGISALSYGRMATGGSR
jgi:hypothetical protein